MILMGVTVSRIWPVKQHLLYSWLSSLLFAQSRKYSWLVITKVHGKAQLRMKTNWEGLTMTYEIYIYPCRFIELGTQKLDPPSAFTTLFNWPPKMELNFEGRKLWVLVIVVLFLEPTVSQLSSSLSSSVEETKDAVFPFPFGTCPSSLSNSSCIWCMTKLRNSCASSCLKVKQKPKIIRKS